jgi:VanZ family protein
MYALMAFLLYYSLYHSIQLRGFNFILGIWIAMVGFGLLIEILQETVAIKRYFSGYDILFNAIGAAFIFILNKIQNKQHETHSKSSRNHIS